MSLEILTLTGPKDEGEINLWPKRYQKFIAGIQDNKRNQTKEMYATTNQQF